MAAYKFVFFAVLIQTIFVSNHLVFAGMNEDTIKFALEGINVYLKCSNETKLFPGLSLKILSTVLNYDPLPKGPNVECYVYCHLEGTGMIKNSQMAWDNIAAVQGKIYSKEDNEKILQAVDTCRKAEKKNKNSCQMAYDAAECYYGNLKKLSVTPIRANLHALGLK